MTTLSNANLTLVELAKRHFDGRLLQIAEVLSKSNAMLQDAPWIQANGASKHVTTKRTALPAGTWRKFNQGAAREASKTTQIEETMGMLQAYSQLDKDLVALAENPQEFRLTEDMAFLEGMSQTVATALLYSTTVGYPEKFDGFTVRYNDTDHASVTSNGGSSTLSSVWAIQWGPTKVHLIYPKGSALGLSMTDKGLATCYDASNNPFEAYMTHFGISVGLVVRDDRCVQRICNIDSGTSATYAFDEDYLIKQLRKMPGEGEGCVIYANQEILAQMDIITKDKTNVQHQPGNAFGMPTMFFRGFPVRKMDAILNTETAVTS